VLIFGLGSVLIFGLRSTLSDGLLGGMVAGLLGVMGIAKKLKPVEKLTFRWADISARKGNALREGRIGGLIGGLTVALIFVARHDLSNLIRSVIAGALIFGLIGGLIRLFIADAIPETRSDVNHGTKRSIKMSLLLLLAGLIGGLLYGLRGLIFGLSDGLIWLRQGLSLGLIFGLSVALFSGGLFVLRHLVVRLFLWKSNSAPLRYVQFLEQSKQLLFLRQVGGGYIFLHRLLREYFVSLLPTSRFYSPKERLRASDNSGV
jgi:eukaryotic-like serine/threonine-protein kinase